jgi:hypothetical protein
VQVRYIHLGPNPGPGAKFVAFLVLALATALILAVVILAFSLFIVAVPAMLVAGGLYYLYRRFMPRRGADSSAHDGIIEGEFRHIDPDAQRIPPQDPSQQQQP